MTEVFITSIRNREQAGNLQKLLAARFPELRINVDPGNTVLSFPCGHSILRVEGRFVYPSEIIQAVNQSGLRCEVLQDKICR
jgi:hypothetical protein